MLGQFVTDHPLLEVRERLAALSDMELSEAETLGDGDVVTVAGIVASMARRYSKKGEPYAQFRLEDLAGGVTVVVFPGQYERAAPPGAGRHPAGEGQGGPARARRGAPAPGRRDHRARPRRPGPAVGARGRAAGRRGGGELHEGGDRQAEGAARRPSRPDARRVRFLSSQGVRPLEVGTFRVEPGAGMLSELRMLLGQEAARVVPTGGVTRVPDAGGVPASSRA